MESHVETGQKHRRRKRSSASRPTTPGGNGEPLSASALVGPTLKEKQEGRARIIRKAGATGAELDEDRKQLKAYEYLCRIGEAKEWIEACIEEKIDDIEDMEEGLRNGIALAKLAKFLDPASVKKIYEKQGKLVFKHTDNINYLYKAMRKVGLPDIFIFETSDLYDKKNIPKVIYCIHALSALCSKKGISPKMQNLVGKLEFTDEQLEKTNQSLAEQGIELPSFANVDQALAKELNEPEETPEEKLLKKMSEHVSQVIKLQSLIRGYRARKAFKVLLSEERERQRLLREEQERIRLEQERLEAIRLEEERQIYEAQVVQVQAQVRMFLARKEYTKKLQAIKDNEDKFVKLQAAVRGRQQRKKYCARLQEFRDHEKEIEKIQATWKAKKASEAYRSRLAHLKSNVNAITKLQSLYKAKNQAQAYRNLTQLRDVDVKTIHTFAPLMDDSDKDFDEELELDRLRGQVIQKIRDNMAAEGEVNEMDIKIALLVSNRVALEDVVRTSTKQVKKAEMRQEGRRVLGLKSLAKENREKLEKYQQLFYLLQTEPDYLARLMYALTQSAGTALQKTMENIMMAMFGYAQNPREEYLFLNLIKAAIRYETYRADDIADFSKGNPLFIKLTLQYTRGASERQYLRDTLSGPIKHMLQQSDLTLETDPVAIYKKLIQDEELNTGQKSKRKYDVDLKEALEDQEVQEVCHNNASKLCAITDQFLDAIVNSLERLPFGLRFIAKELREALLQRYSSNKTEVDKIIRNLLYYRYMNPAICAPDTFDVIEGQISPLQRKNLAEVAKLLQFTALGRETSEITQDSLADYINVNSKKFTRYFKDAINVPSSEEHFNIDEYNDLSRRTKPTIVMNFQEILTVHTALLQNVDAIAPQDPNEHLRIVLNELGELPQLPEDDRSRNQEIQLTLVNRFAKLTDENADKRQLFLETKRQVINVLRVQTGRNLLDILESLSSQKDEGIYAKFVEMEKTRFAEQVGKARSFERTGSAEAMDRTGTSYNRTSSILTSPTSAHSPGLPTTFAQLKKNALENVAKLEAMGLVSRRNGYQDLLNAIAKDILNKNKRREQRRQQVENLKKTLQSLDEKAKFLDEQKASYHGYVQSCMANLQRSSSKKGHARPLPFSKHWSHQRELQKNGKMPKFGSYKYSAGDLFRKGVLVSLDDYSPRQYGQINLTISSDQPGVFSVEVSLLGIKMPNKLEVRLEDLLELQYNGVNVMELFDGAKINVNLMLYLINKKFYA